MTKFLANWEVETDITLPADIPFLRYDDPSSAYAVFLRNAQETRHDLTFLTCRLKHHPSVTPEQSRRSLPKIFWIIFPWSLTSKFAFVLSCIFSIGSRVIERTAKHFILVGPNLTTTHHMPHSISPFLTQSACCKHTP